MVRRLVEEEDVGVGGEHLGKEDTELEAARESEEGPRALSSSLERMPSPPNPPSKRVDAHHQRC
jgi:hypothetical protein